MVSILMPVRDTPAALLRQAMESITAQSYRDFEFLVLDDGSLQSATLCELERQAATDARIRIHRHESCGVTKTLNRGLHLAQREYIARQDADDWSDPQRLAIQVEFLRMHPRVALCGTNALTHRDDGSALWVMRLPEGSEQIRTAFWKQNPFVHGSVMFRAEAARSLGGYREEFLCAQDYDFFWRLADRYDAVNLAQPLYHYRYHGGAVSAGRAREQACAHRAAQILARSRLAGDTGAITASGALALAYREIEADDGVLRALLKQADHRLLAGDTWGAARDYLKLIRGEGNHPLVWGKLARWAVYTALPPAREMCFR